MAQRTDPTFAHRALVAVSLAAAVGVLLFLVWTLLEALLLVVTGLLLALFLGALADWVAGHTPLSRGWALALVVLVLGGLLVGSLWLRGPNAAEQVRQLRDALPEAVERLRSRITEYRAGRELVDAAPTAGELLSNGGSVFSRITGVVSGTLGAVANLWIILLMGLFLAAQPGVYLSGLVALVSPRWRDRVRAALEDAGQAMRQWLVSKVIRMLFIGGATWLALKLLGVPVAFILGLIAALLSFVPNFGPLIAAVPAVLLALMQGTGTALAVVGIYVAIQIIEGNVLDPLLTQAIVKIPPGLTFAMQIFLGVLAGAVGVAVATPLAAALVVLVRELYVVEVLGDPSAAEG